MKYFSLNELTSNTIGFSSLFEPCKNFTTGIPAYCEYQIAKQPNRQNSENTWICERANLSVPLFIILSVIHWVAGCVWKVKADRLEQCSSGIAWWTGLFIIVNFSSKDRNYASAGIRQLDPNSFYIYVKGRGIAPRFFEIAGVISRIDLS